MISISINRWWFSTTIHKGRKQLLRLAFSLVIHHSSQSFLLGQNNLLVLPETSISEQLLHQYQKEVNTGEVVMNLIVEDQKVIPTKSFILFQNHPNPFIKETTVQFELLHNTDVSLTIYDPAGAVLKEYKGYFEKGRNQFQIHGRDLKEYGILYYQMTTKYQILSKKMIFKKIVDTPEATSDFTPSSNF